MECQAVRLQCGYRKIPQELPQLMQVALSDHKITDSPAQSQYVFTLFSASPARMPRHGPGYSSTTARRYERRHGPLPQQKRALTTPRMLCYALAPGEGVWLFHAGREADAMQGRLWRRLAVVV